ncbi:MAG: hypothetical protein MUQ30_08615 [Anaerolineae bacterium]|nr:hypothetical protein [Anaerolineae bacterium]
MPTEFVEMDPMVVRGYPGDTIEENIGGLEALTTQTTEDFEAERGEEHLRRSSPVPGDPLPFTEVGWDATTILSARAARPHRGHR